MTREEAEKKIDDLLVEASKVAQEFEIHLIAATTQTKDDKEYVCLVACGADLDSAPREIGWAYSMLGYEIDGGGAVVCEATSRMVRAKCKERQPQEATTKEDLLSALDRLKEILGAAETA